MTTSTADLWDEPGGRFAAVATQFRDFGRELRFSGPTRTVRCFEDNVLLTAMLETPGRGSVLVVDGGGSLTCAHIDDRIAGLAIANECSGLVINGAVRDSAALPIGIKALGTSPCTSGKSRTGETDIDLQFCDDMIRPGVLVCADEDGVLIDR